MSKIAEIELLLARLSHKTDALMDFQKRVSDRDDEISNELRKLGQRLVLLEKNWE